MSNYTDEQLTTANDLDLAAVVSDLVEARAELARVRAAFTAQSLVLMRLNVEKQRRDFERTSAVEDPLAPHTDS